MSKPLQPYTEPYPGPCAPGALLQDLGHLPVDVRERLLMGFVGSAHLRDLADTALAAVPAASGQEALLRALAQATAKAAWEWDLLDGPAAGKFAGLAAGQSTDPTALATAQAVSQCWSQPNNPAYFLRLMQRGEPERLMRYIEDECTREPANLYWWQQAAHTAKENVFNDRLLSLLGRAWPLGDGPLLHALRAEALLGLGQAERAGQFFLQAHAAMASHVLLCKAARCFQLAGDHEQALMLRGRALRDAPWNANLALALHDTLSDAATRTATLQGSVAVCLCSFNKAALLDETLLTSGEQITLQAAAIKLRNKYDTGELETLRRKLFNALEQDLAAKAKRLEHMGYGRKATS